MARTFVIRLLILSTSILLAACTSRTEDVNVPPSATSPYIPPAVSQTAHFVIHSSATPGQTMSVSNAAEILYSAYVGAFPRRTSGARFQIVLYKDQLEFKRNNRTHSWAEAYYLMPRSYAYPGRGANPHHWMNHEIVHQLLYEAGGYRLQRWLNEGIATYFSSSMVKENALQLGTPDPNAYPIWWLSSLQFGAKGEVRFEDNELVSLRELVEGSGPPVGSRVNNYYIAYWSLVHFLLHGQDGRYQANFLTLVEHGGLPADFKQLVGNYEEIEPLWHAHLLGLKKASGK